MRSLLLTVLLSASLALPVPVSADTAVPDSAAQISLSFAPVVRATSPAVVNIYATRLVETQSSPFAGDPFFGDFFRQFPSRPQVQNSLGSGVIVSDDGLVVSNYHVVGEATNIRVVLTDRREVGATVLLADQEADLAVLKLDQTDDLTALPLRDSDTVEVGDLVLAIGNPFGVGQTVTSGIISGLARTGIFMGNARGYFLQTDAAINPGNSGGALVDGQGRLVGINTAILTRSGGSNGIGFAVPANLVARFIEQARAGETRFQRPWAGVSAQVVDPDLAAALGMGRPDGIILTGLHPDSPFAVAGLGKGDVILSVDGLPVTTPAEMIFRMSVTGIGRTIAVEALTADGPVALDIDLVAAPEDPARDLYEVPRDAVLAGLVATNINPAVTQELGLDLSAEGVAVLRAEGPAARIGLRPGDILFGVNGRIVETTRELADALRERTRTWQIGVMREGRPMTLRFRI